MATPHINAKEGDFSTTVLMPGDPLRAKFIAENFITNAREVTNVRGMLGYTGTYKGKSISVMGHGMGIPSCSIYVTELFKFYNVEKIIRVGSCGGVLADVKLGDIIVAIGASTNSNVNRIRFNGCDFAATADYELLNKTVISAKNLGQEIKIGNIYSEDLFYNPDNTMISYLEKYRILGVEMEAAGIYGIAAELNKKALAICTVSDHIVSGESMSSEQRQIGFKNMIEIALEATII